MSYGSESEKLEQAIYTLKKLTPPQVAQVNRHAYLLTLTSAGKPINLSCAICKDTVTMRFYTEGCICPKCWRECVKPYTESGKMGTGTISQTPLQPSFDIISEPTDEEI